MVDPEESLVLIEINQTKVVMNKPVNVDMSMLYMSKTKLYEFRYDCMLPKYGPQCKDLYTDTDSLVYQILCNDLLVN